MITPKTRSSVKNVVKRVRASIPPKNHVKRRHATSLRTKETDAKRLNDLFVPIALRSLLTIVITGTMQWISKHF
jgi:hypothetical protein